MTRRTMPYHRRYHGDALQGYMPLTLDERGAYTTILDLIYDNGGPIVRNERYLSGMMNCSVRLARSLIDALIQHQKLYVTRDHKLSNHRAERELEAAISISLKRAESASKKGGKVAESTIFLRKNNGISQQLQSNSSAIAGRLSQDSQRFPRRPQAGDGDIDTVEKTSRKAHETAVKHSGNDSETMELLNENSDGTEQLQGDCTVIPEPYIDKKDLYLEPVRESEQIEKDLSYLADMLSSKSSGRTPHPPSPAGRIPGART
jgi:uncharacterized protein YdaU (DUF1376 family)